MSTITPVGLEQYQSSQRIEAPPSDELGQDEFLKLMLTQLKHQDPFKPLENGEFIGQMAQFSTVSGIEQMQMSLEDLTGSLTSSQTLEASKLVGRNVLIESDTVILNEENSIGGRFDLSTSTGDVRLSVMDSSGAVVSNYEMGEKSAGRHDFTWDGRDQDNNRMPPGNYTVQITRKDVNSYEAVTTLVSRKIDSVEFSNGGATELYTASGETIGLSEVRAIRESQTGN